MTTQEFIFDAPLYQKVEGENAIQILNDLCETYSHKYDGFNAQRGVESTFVVYRKPQCRHNLEYPNHPQIPTHRFFKYTEAWHVSLRCGRYEDEIEIMILLDTSDKSIMKVGQYPTIADMHKVQIKQYKSVLTNEEMKEFTRAIGLAASGVGIGSFVYLRRIFENQIAEAFEMALKNEDVVKDDFVRARMDEKIEKLKKYLPETLVEARSIYGILSKGIHSLTEEECLLSFDVLKQGIEMILDDKLEQKRKVEKRKQTMASISALKAKMGKEADKIEE